MFNFCDIVEREMKCKEKGSNGVVIHFGISSIEMFVLDFNQSFVKSKTNINQKGINSL